jgi:hypothetical protein
MIELQGKNRRFFRSVEINKRKGILEDTDAV